jgi:hypothetical protein
MGGPSLQGPRSNNNPDPMSEYVRRLVDLQRQLNDLTGSVLKSAGIDMSPDGMTINSALDVLGTLGVSGSANLGGNTDISGDLDVTGPMSVGGTLNVTGDATFSGNLAVPNGSITNAALSNPVTSAIAAPGVSAGWAASTGYGTKASTSIPIPGGYSQALVFATGSITFQDGSPNRFDTRVGIAGGYGAGLPNLANTVGCSSEAHSRTLTGLSGGSITLEVQCLAAIAAAAQAANTATVTGFAIFFR